MSAAVLAGRRVTVMGLGLQGGGVEVVRFLAARGAVVTVTDKRPAEKLRESLDAIAGLGVRTVLGQHVESDFTSAELVVANPAVAPRNPLRVAARAARGSVPSAASMFPRWNSPGRRRSAMRPSVSVPSRNSPAARCSGVRAPAAVEKRSTWPRAAFQRPTRGSSAESTTVAPAGASSRMRRFAAS